MDGNRVDDEFAHASQVDPAHISASKPRVTLVELNEFNPDFMKFASQELGLSNLSEVLSWRHTSTTTDDEVEHQGLDPWVQWVNVHTGMPSAEHRVKRLGDTTTQPQPFWVDLGEDGVRWGAWGVMNTPRSNATEGAYFFPDPWSFEEAPFPERLNDILRLPRYVSKNYLDLERGRLLSEGAALVRGLLAPDNWKVSFAFTYRFLAEIARRREINLHTLTTFVDYLGFCFFEDLNRKTDPQFRVIFLNLIAHLQHQFWRSGDTIDPEMELGLRLTDRIMGRLINDQRDGDALIVMNGLRQKNVDGEGFIVYRQNNPIEILKWVGVDTLRVEQCMTHDAHAYFRNSCDADKASTLLDACHLDDGTKAFFVERKAGNQVFYQIAFEHQVSDDTRIVLHEKSTLLSELISVYAVRTGAHIQDGDIYSNGIEVPDEMHNHEICKYIKNFFRSTDEPC